jgi:glutamate 5-kinase
MRDFVSNPPNMKNVKRVVIKVGTSTLAYPTGSLNLRRVERLVRVFADLHNSGKEIIFVTSGAVGVGAGLLGLSGKPSEIPVKQACAAVGQCSLMAIYDDEFLKYGLKTAQILVTRDVVSNETRNENVRNTLKQLLQFGVVPIINANDSISVEHLDFDENDTLSAYAAQFSGADLLVLLTDVDGLYDKNPATEGAKLIPFANKVTAEMLASAKEKGSALSSGGMLTKLEAAEISLKNKINTVIMNGNNPDKLYDLFDNKAICTIFSNDV